ncbi:MAG: PDZ domain-containing protein, partial [Planctomycetota bacterium]
QEPEGESDEDGEPPAADAVIARSAERAEAALGAFPTAITTAALIEIQARGGAVAMLNGFNRAFAPGVGGPLSQPLSIALDDRWTGGEEGLKYLRSVSNLTQVHLTDDCPIPPKARADLIARRYGNFEVERRGKAFLGVQFTTGGAGGCQIGEVTPGGPAQKAGLRRGDIIIQFADTPINTPATLLDAIREQGEVGVPADVTVVRFGKTQKVEVTLSRWPDQTIDPLLNRGFPARPAPFQPALPRPVPMNPRLLPRDLAPRDDAELEERQDAGPADPDGEPDDE